MKIHRFKWMLPLLAALVFGAALADAKIEEKTQVEFTGMMGKAFKIFGGKAAKEGTVSTKAVKGDRMMERTEDNGHLIDLAAEKVFEINFGKKTYTVKTFAEIREEMRKAMEDMKKHKGEMAEAQQPKEGQIEYEVDFDVKETGNKMRFANYDCRQIVWTFTVRQKGKKLEEAGGGILTLDMWLGPKIGAHREFDNFHLRYAKALALDQMIGMAEMGQALMMYPAMQQAMKKLQEKRVNLEGDALKTKMTYESVAGKVPPTGAEKEEQQPPSKGLGGLMGKLGKKLSGGGKSAEPGGRSTVYTATTETLSIATAATAADVSIPEGYKQK